MQRHLLVPLREWTRTDLSLYKSMDFSGASFSSSSSSSASLCREKERETLVPQVEGLCLCAMHSVPGAAVTLMVIRRGGGDLCHCRPITSSVTLKWFRSFEEFLLLLPPSLFVGYR